MKLRLYLIVSALFLAGTAYSNAAIATFQEGVDGYTGTHDTVIRGGAPDTNYGSSASLAIDGSDGGGENHGLIRFENIFGDGPNQVPRNAAIHAATLTLVLFDPGDPATIHRMLKPWDEATVTWNTFDEANFDGVTEDGIEAAVDPDAPQFSTPVGTLVIELNLATLEAWAAGAPNHGWFLNPTTGGGWDVRSSEFADPSLRPKLTIVWGTSGAPFVKNLTPSTTGFTVSIQDGAGGGKVVNPSSVSLSLDGTPVTPSASSTVDAPLVAIDANTQWRYNASGTDLGTGWRASAFNDSSWPQGPALLGFESGSTAEPLRTALPQQDENGFDIITYYFRHRFNVTTALSDIKALKLRHVVDDGAIVYLNGQEINRFSMPTGDVAFDTGANSHENQYEGPFQIPLNLLVAGENVIAVEVHQTGPGSSDMVFGAELVATIASSSAKVGDTTTVSYTSPTLFESGSQHTVQVSFSDTATPPGNYTETLQFTAPVYATIPSNLKVPDAVVNKNAPGFNVRMHQIEAARPGGNNWPAPLNQLYDLIIDPLTGEPFLNLIDNQSYPEEAGKWQGFVYREEAVINYNQDARDNPSAGAGNFRPDLPIPGIYGILGANDHIAMETTTFLELPAGMTRMVVNCDDGFIVNATVHPQDLFGIQLGIRNPGGGALDTVFDIFVEEAGIYPIVLYWWEGTGGANIEWFTIDMETDTRILVNDRSNPKAVKAYRTATFNPPFASSITPAPGSVLVAPNTSITIVLEDTVTAVQQNSVELFVNGTKVTPSITKTGKLTEIKYAPTQNLPAGSTVNVRVVYGDNANPPSVITRQFSFKTRAATVFVFQQGVDGYSGTRDTFITSGDPTTPRNEDETLQIDLEGEASGEYALIRFDDIFGAGANQIPAKSKIASATLRLFFTNNGDSPNLHRMLKAWQDTDTWDTLVDGISTDGVEAAATRDVSFGGSGTPVIINLPVSTLQAWSDGTAQNHGWVMLPSGTDGADFSSSKHTTISNRPMLTVEIEGTAGPEPSVSVARTATGIRITFAGTLQSSDTVLGPWTDMTATSPADISVVGAAKFYRTRQ